MSNYGLGTGSGSGTRHGHRMSQSELEWQLAHERRRTLAEWTHHLARISSTSTSAAAESSSKGDPRRWGTPGGYNGLYKHMSSLDQLQQPQLVPKPNQRQTDWKYKNDPGHIQNSELFRQDRNRLRKRGLAPKWELEKGEEDGDQEKESPVFISEAETKDIQRCFIAADVTQDGYLSCEEFKNFMEYRRCPITHLEARRLLYRTDREYHSFIDLDQIMYLVFNCGLSTQQERVLSPAEFNYIIERVRSPSVTGMHDHIQQGNNGNTRKQYSTPAPAPTIPASASATAVRRGHQTASVTVIEDNIEPESAISYFEDVASHVQLKESQEARYHAYRRGIRESRTSQGDNAAPGRSGEGGYRQANYYPPPPGWANMLLHSQDPSAHLPPLNFRKLKGEWETIVTVSEEERAAQQAKSLLIPAQDRQTSKAETSVSKPLTLRQCREELQRNRSISRSNSRSSHKSESQHHLPAGKPENGGQDQAPPFGKANLANPSVSFATELRQVLQVYKQRADSFALESTGKRIMTSGSDAGSTNVIFKNQASDQISTHAI